MEIELDVLSSLSIKSKKPWYKFSWLEETEPPHGLYLFSEGSRMGQLSLSSGKVRRKLSTLSSIQDRIALVVTSPSGSHLGGLLLEGDLFVWDKWKDLLLTFVTPLSRIGSEKAGLQALKGIKLFLSDTGEQALIVSGHMELYLWEMKEHHSLWWKLFPPPTAQLPKSRNREMTVEATFHTSPILGKCCTCVFVFTDRSAGDTVITNLFINWPSRPLQFYSRFTSKHTTESQCSGLLTFPFVGTLVSTQEKHKDSEKKQVRFKEDVKHGDQQKGQVMAVPLQDLTNTSSVRATSQPSLIVSTSKETPHTYFDQLSSQESLSPFETSWHTIARHVTSSDPSHHNPLTGRGSYVCKLSPSCSVGALAVNCAEATDTEVLFLSPLMRAEHGVQIYPREIQGLSGRTFWISDMVWTRDGLLLVCITKRGSLVILPRFGPPLTLIARGCSIEMGPCSFLPLHPLITVTGISQTVTNHETSESSERDTLRQRFSVSTHPHLPLLLCSDGYSLTVLKLPSHLSLPALLSNLVISAREMLALPPPVEPKCLANSTNHSVTQSLQLHNIAASLPDTTGLGDTLGSSSLGFTSHAGGYVPTLSGVDGGGLHFAGLGSTLQFSSSVSDDKLQLNAAVASLLSAWGILLTCGVRIPGNGGLAEGSVRDSRELDSYSSDLENATSLLLSSILSVIEILHEREKGVHSRDSFKQFVHSLLSLVPFDSISQSHLSTVTMLMNSILIKKLHRSLSKHQSMISLDEDCVTHQAWIEHVDSMTKTVSEISDLLDTVVIVTESTYDYTAVNNTVNCFCTPTSLQANTERQDITCSLQSLSPAGSLLAKVSLIFQEDINKCEHTVKKQISQAVGGNSTREMNTLYNRLTTCLNKALVTLQYVQTQVRWIVPTHAQTDNPITSNVFKSHKVQKLVSKLEAHDIQGALEYVHSLINYGEAVSSDHCFVKLSSNARTVVHLFCQVIASFFCDKAPYITISLHSFHKISLSRLKLSMAAQNEALSNFWTVDHTLELLIISQSWLEACNFLLKLGEWKKAFFLSSIFIHHSRLLKSKQGEYIELKKLSQNVATDNLLQCIGLKFSTSSCKADSMRLCCLAGLSDSHLQRRDVISFVPECLKVCAEVEMDDVLLTIVVSLVSEVADCCKELSLEVPSGLYLPAPPLFCPQPAVQSKDFVQCPMEYKLRHKLSTVIRCLLLVLSSSNTLLPCAQWYCSQLEQLPSIGGISSLRLPGETCSELPRGLFELAQDESTFHFSHQGGGTVKVLLGVFRELCGLIWLLHVRDQFSAHLRQLQPSPLKEASSVRVVQEASLWGARYLSFTKFLGSNSSDLLKGATLSVLSELETGAFLINVLTYCFPTGTAPGVVGGRLNRLVSRLRSAQGVDPGALSAQYHAQSQVTLSAQQKLGDSHGQFCELVLADSESDGYLLQNDSITVGSVLFEYSSTYIEFLNNFLSVVIPEKSGSVFSPPRESSLLTLSQLHSSLDSTPAKAPSLACFQSKVRLDNGNLACWERVLPLLESLHSWSCTISPQVTYSRPRAQKHQRKKLKGKKMDTEQGSSGSIKVSVSPKLVVKCLQEREERENQWNVSQAVSTATEWQDTGEGVRMLSDSTNATASAKHQEEIKVSQKPTKPQFDIVGNSSLSRGENSSRASSKLPLIQLPPGTLKGQISGNDLMYAHEHSHSLHSLPVLTVEGLETEVDDSLSTGELPSALDYSVGEKRSGNVTITENTHLTETLTEISEAATFSFNDFGLPTSSSSNLSTLVTPSNQPPVKKSQVIDESIQHSAVVLAQENSTNGDQQTSEMVDLGSELVGSSIDEARNEEAKLVNGYKEECTYDASGNKELGQVNGTTSHDKSREEMEPVNELDTDDSGTFTVSSSTTLLQELQSQHGTELDFTLRARESNLSAGPLPVVEKNTVINPPVIQPNTVINPPIIQPNTVINPPVIQTNTVINPPTVQPNSIENPSDSQANTVTNRLPETLVTVSSVSAGSGRADEQVITSIVRTEMREMLELQQQNLMSLLKAVEANAAQGGVQKSGVDCSTQKDYDGETHDPRWSSMKSHNKVSHNVPVQESSQKSIMPTLNVEDLLSQSPTETSYSNPQPSEDSADSHDNIFRAQNEPPTDQKQRRDQSMQTAPGDDFANGSRFGLSELTTVTSSPGAIPNLSQSSLTSTIPRSQQVKSVGHQIMSTPKPSRAHIPAPVLSQFSLIGQPSSSTCPPLLQLDSSVGNVHNEQEKPVNKLEIVYPDFARNLSLISSQQRTSAPVAPASVPPASSQTQHPLTQRPVLLNLPDRFRFGSILYSNDPSRQTAHPHNQPSSFPQLSPTPHSHNHFTQPSPAPHSHNQFPQPSPAPHSHNQFPQPSSAPRSHNHFPQPSPAPRSHSQLPQSSPAPHTHNQPPFFPQPSQTHFHPPLLFLPPRPSPQHHASTHHPTSKNVTNPKAPPPLPYQPMSYQFPNVPLIPFVPKFLPPPVSGVQGRANNSTTGPPLLRANDPFTAIKQNGLKLLEIPKTHPPKVMSLDTKQKLSNIQKSTNNFKETVITESQPTLEEIDVPVVTSVSDSSLYQERKKKEHRKHKKQRCKVAWEQKEPFQVESKLEVTKQRVEVCPSPDLESQNTDTSIQNPGQTSETQNQQVVEALPGSPTTPQRTNGTATDKPGGLRRPTLGTQSQRYYPEDIPMESLEIRRLNLQAQSRPTTISKTAPPIISNTASPAISSSAVSESTCTLSESKDTHISRHSNNEENTLCSISESLDSLIANTLPPLRLTPREEVHTDPPPPKTATALTTLKDSDPSSGVFHPPVLALNVSQPLSLDQSSLSAVSLSSTVTLTATDQEETIIDPFERKASTKTALAYKKLAPSQLPSPENQASKKFMGHADNMSSVSSEMSSEGDPPAHSDVIKDLGARAKPGTVTSTALKRLQEIEEQLNAIENTAKTVEGEFRSSKQMLHTIDQLQLITAPVSDAESAPDYALQRERPDDNGVTPKLVEGESGIHAPRNRSDGSIESVEQAGKKVQFQFQDTSSHKHQATNKEHEQVISKKEASLRRGSPAHNQGTGNRSKDELREWMKVKRKQRLAEFRQQKEKQHKMEKHPFKPPSGETVPKLQSLRAEKYKRERQQEFLDKRIDDAFALMNDMLTAKPSLNTGSSSHSPSKNLRTKIQPDTSSDKQRSAKPWLPSRASSSPMHSKQLIEGKHRSWVGAHKTPKKERGHNALAGTYTKSDIPSCSSSPKRLSSDSARKLSSVEGLTNEEQVKIADILASSMYDGSSVSSGSILTDIDWEEVDKILAS